MCFSLVLKARGKLMSQSAAVIAAANSKGGCGKSTTILILAGEYAAQGCRVHIIDADPKKRLVRWAQAGVKPDRITVSEANVGSMRDEIEKARTRAEVVLIDVEGTANAALTLAVAYANLVIVPATISPGSRRSSSLRTWPTLPAATSPTVFSGRTCRQQSAPAK